VLDAPIQRHLAPYLLPTLLLQAGTSSNLSPKTDTHKVEVTWCAISLVIAPKQRNVSFHFFCHWTNCSPFISMMMSSRVPIILSLVLARALYAGAFSSVRPAQHDVVFGSLSTSTSLQAFNLRDADTMEELVGGERYEMVPLPDSMVDTTIFVGNLNEFVKDEDLSDFFQSVSILQSLPACVARRPNFESLHYGFVTFPTVEEKEVSETKNKLTKKISLCLF
jgi:hypothetical protein